MKPNDGGVVLESSLELSVVHDAVARYGDPADAASISDDADAMGVILTPIRDIHYERIEARMNVQNSSTRGLGVIYDRFVQGNRDRDDRLFRVTGHLSDVAIDALKKASRPTMLDRLKGLTRRARASHSLKIAARHMLNNYQ